MLGITHFELFVAAVLLLNLTPGPDTAYIVGRSVAQGRGAGLMSALGISAGCCVHVLACTFGLTALLAASATAFSVVKWGGAAYLVYLGVRLIFSREAAAQAAAEPAPDAGARPLRQLFLQGFWTNVLNPKVILFFVSFFPQFVGDGGSHRAAFAVLGAVFVAMSATWGCFVAWIAGSVTRRFAGRPGVKKWLNRTVGSAFVGLGLRLAATR